MSKPKAPFTFEEVSTLLKYSPDTGVIHWKVSRSNLKAGDIAGHQANGKNGKSYRVVKLKGKHIFSHRLAWLLHTREWPGADIDHINGNGLDNRIDNLREAPSSENNRNHRKHSTNTSGHTGVCWDKSRNKWVAQIWVKGRAKKIGRYASFSDAVSARKEEEVRLEYHQNHGTDRPL